MLQSDKEVEPRDDETGTEEMGAIEDSSDSDEDEDVEDDEDSENEMQRRFPFSGLISFSRLSHLPS